MKYLLMLLPVLAVTQTHGAANSDPHDLNGVYMTGGMPGGGMGAGPGNAAATGPVPGVPNFANLGVGEVPPLEDNGRMRCRPQFQMGSSPYAGQIIQTPGRVTLITEFNHIIRRIYLDEQFPETIEPSYTGYSIGHWEGDTLVVETRGLKSDALGMSRLKRIDRVLERIHKTDDGSVVQEATLEGTNAQGGIETMSLSARNVPRPELHLMEFICEDTADTFYTK